MFLSQRVCVREGDKHLEHSCPSLLRLMQVARVRHPNFSSCVARHFYGEKRTRTKAGRKRKQLLL